MTTDLNTLAAAVVQSPHWRWRPGMSEHRGWLVLSVLPSGQIDTVFDGCSGEAREPYPDPLPDLQDPATLGCLLALVREAWGDPAIYVSIGHGGYYSVRRSGGLDLRLALLFLRSEPTALVDALLAAPPPAR